MTNRASKISDLFGEMSNPTNVDKIKDIRSKMLAECGGNKSELIRTLFGMDMTRSQISKIVDVRYQFVNNVISEILRKKI